MDINSQLQPIIAGMINDLKGSINAELKQQLSSEIIKTLASTELTSIINDAIAGQIQARLAKFDFHGTSEQELRTALNQLFDQINKSLATNANNQITTWVNTKLSQINIGDSVTAVVQQAIGDNLKGTTFPEGSIPHTSVNFEGFKITGDAIHGGIISKFGSDGIEDRATHVQMTLLDHAVAFENPLYTPEANITGNLVVNGQVKLYGTLDNTTSGFKALVDDASDAVRLKLNTELFDGFSNTVFDKIRTQGIDLDRITQNNREVLSGNRIGYHITDSNLQRVGVLNDLQTSGENLLCETLYVSQKRIGVNTMDPDATVSIWDQEVEVTVSKLSQDTAQIGSPRNQTLVVQSNNKQNIVARPDGSVQIDNLKIGDIQMSASAILPNYPGTAGQIVWNANPHAGTVIGWVCLGATRWAGFGRIENT